MWCSLTILAGHWVAPVRIPQVYDGRGKTFFYFSLDATVLHQSGNNAYTVPTPLMRAGDFSEDPNVVSNGIWDPTSTAGPQSDGTFQRTAFGTPVNNTYGPGCFEHIGRGRCGSGSDHVQFQHPRFHPPAWILRRCSS